MDTDQREILDSYAAETEEHIKTATECILALETERDDENINSLFRAFHTIKGNSRMLGFEAAGKLAHATENLIAKLRNGSLEPSKQVVDLILASLDAIGSMTTESVKEGIEDATVPEALLNAIQLVAEGTESAQNVIIANPEVRKAAALPLPPKAPEPVKAEPDKHAPEATPTSAPLSILVVEDDFISRKALVALLKPYGHCDIAVDGKEAVEAFSLALEDKPYDLVCMDIMMPEMDGFEAARQLRSSEMIHAVRKLKGSATGSAGCASDFNRNDAVIIMTSSLDDPEHYINACYRCGANAYIVKPIDKERLLSALHRTALIQRV